MPCRPSPDEDAWAAEQVIERVRQSAAVFDRQRGVTLHLLSRLLRRAGLLQSFGQAVLALLQTAPTTPMTTVGAASGDENAMTQRQMRDAEVSLCVARFALLQIVQLLPPQIVMPYAADIYAERSDHLLHRMDDCAAELTMLTSRITALTGSDANAAEIVRLQAEVDRLRGMDPQQLLGNRDFTAAPLCPLCRHDLPSLPGLDPDVLELIASDIGTGNKIQAIMRLHHATHLGLRMAKAYVECPHSRSSPEPTATPSPVDSRPVPCPKCGTTMPPVPGVAPMLVSLLLSQFTGKRKRKENAIKTLQITSHWGLKESREYLECPHRLPGLTEAKGK